MSMYTRNPDAAFRLVGTIALYLLPLVGIAGVAATVLSEQLNLLILSLYLVIPLLIAPVLFRILGSRKEISLSLDDSSFRLLLVSYLLCFSLSVIVLTIFAVRPWAYYVIVVTMAVTVLIEITGFRVTKEGIAIVLLQIMGLMLNVNWGVTLKYFRFIGRTDVMIHTQYITSLIQTGHVTDVFFDYQPFPLWHILNAALYLTGGGLVPTDKIVAVAEGLIFLCLPVLAYLITLRLFKDQRLALLAALLSFFFPDMTYFTMSGISRSVASLLLAFLIYLMIDEKRKNKLLLIGLVTSAIVIYHSITIIFVVLILLIIWLLQKILLRKEEQIRRINLIYLSITAVVTLAYWAVFGQVLLQELYGNIIVSAPAGMLTKGVLISPMAEAFNYLQYLPAVLFVLFGLLAVLASKRFDNRAKLFVLVALLLVWVTFPGPQYMVNKLMYNFGIDRFSEYTYPILIATCAAGVGTLFYRSNKYLRAFLIVLFAVWVMLSISSDWVASDNPLVKRPFYTYYLTQDETSAFNRLATSATGVILTDYTTGRYMDSIMDTQKFDMLEVANDSSHFYQRSPGDVIIVRSGELSKRPLKLSTNNLGYFKPYPRVDTYDYYYKDSAVWKDLRNYDRVYDSPSVDGYV